MKQGKQNGRKAHGKNKQDRKRNENRDKIPKLRYTTERCGENIIVRTKTKRNTRNVLYVLSFALLLLLLTCMSVSFISGESLIFSQ